MSSTDSREKRTKYTKNDNLEIMIGSDTDETIQGLFYSLLERHGRQDLEESIKVAILCLIMAMDYIISVII